jgi:hypothetical protein
MNQSPQDATATIASPKLRMSRHDRSTTDRTKPFVIFLLAKKDVTRHRLALSTPSPFKWRHFLSDVILLNVRWYCRYPLSYHKLEEMMLEQGLKVDPSTKSLCDTIRKNRKARKVCFVHSVLLWLGQITKGNSLNSQTDHHGYPLNL